MNRLFVTQELVTAICAGLYTEHLLEGDVDCSSVASKKFRRAALVSTHFFHGMMPCIWGSVELLGLFKRGLIPAKLTWHCDRIQVSISQPISRETMSRFHFYAPYIKVLQVPMGFRTAEVDNWEPLVEYSKDNELLPNLVELECEKFDPRALSVFLLPSTRRLTIGPPDSRKRLDIANAKHLLEHAANLCPGLRSLEFHPKPTEEANTPVLSQTSTLLSSFKDLRRLVSTPIVLQSAALQALARLPHLATLSIKLDDSEHWDSSCQQVLSGGFPALSDLTLCLKRPQDAKRFWELIPLGTLKKLDLILEANGNPEFISTLCRASPQITELALRFADYKGYYGLACGITADIFEHLACLPIKTCLLDGAKLDFEDAWAKVASSWPNLRSIECLAQSAYLKDLLLLSSNLPKLEAIKCDLDLERAAAATKGDWSPVGWPSFYPQLRHMIFRMPDMGYVARYGSKNTGCESELRDLARFLAYFWPKMTIEAADDGGYDCENKYDRTCTELLESREVSFNLWKELVLTYVQVYHKD